MSGRSDARGAEVQFFRICLRKGNQIVKGLEWKVGMDNYGARHCTKDDDGLQLFGRIIGKLAIDRVCRMNTDRSEQQGLTVGLCCGDAARPYIATHAGFVFYHERHVVLGR